MIVLSPGVFVNKLKETDKVFPIEIHVGGNLGNNGITDSFFNESSLNGKFTLFFKHSDNQNRWTNLLQ